MVPMEELSTSSFYIKVELFNLKDALLRLLEGQFREPGKELRISKLQ
jgi:hypothetical protein